MSQSEFELLRCYETERGLIALVRHGNEFAICTGDGNVIGKYDLLATAECKLVSVLLEITKDDYPLE